MLGFGAAAEFELIDFWLEFMGVVRSRPIRVSFRSSISEATSPDLLLTGFGLKLIKRSGRDKDVSIIRTCQT